MKAVWSLAKHGARPTHMHAVRCIANRPENSGEDQHLELLEIHIGSFLQCQVRPPDVTSEIRVTSKRAVLSWIQHETRPTHMHSVRCMAYRPENLSAMPEILAL